MLEPRGSDVLVGALLCEPVDPAACAGVIFFNNSGYLGMCGHGTIDGREVCVFSQDGTVFGGALGEVYGEKMTKIQRLAVTTGPGVQLVESYPGHCLECLVIFILIEPYTILI
mgnify:CR=1 FL=1